jgi:carbonyl reductase 1
LGQTAIKELEKLNIKAHFHQLDIDNQESIDRFAKYLKEKHGGLDVLINNAAIAFKVNFFRIEEILFKIKHYLY